MSLPITPVAPGGRHAVLNTGGFALTEACYDAGQTLPSHAHRQAVLTFILRGSVREKRGSGYENCQSLGLVAIPAGEPHAESFPASGSRCLIIEVSDERAEFIRSFSGILDRPSYRNDLPVAGLGLQTYQEFRQRDDVAPLAIEGLLLQMAALTSRSSARGPVTGEPSWLARVRERIHAEFRGTLRMSDLAAEAGVHPVYLARAFRQRYACSPAEYARRLRVEAAGELLVRSDLPLSQVALKAGFSDQSHLAHQFRRMVGVSPGRYRLAARQ
ncbi:MAG TPA: AraC family transcriptional regulator [Gemmatimonadales bacterium]|nr:AraC family transcriptional regulator [Gemmatimonadales bacterium]